MISQEKQPLKLKGFFLKSFYLSKHHPWKVLIVTLTWLIEKDNH